MRVLFVCTGNIFRSMTAEYALRSLLGSESVLTVRSAGIVADPAQVAPFVADYLRSRGLDVSPHRQTRIDAAAVSAEGLVVAMGLNHLQFIREKFGINVPLFNEVCFGLEQGVLDVDEMYPDWGSRIDEARAYARTVIDHICDAMPLFISRMDDYLLRKGMAAPQVTTSTETSGSSSS